MRPLGGAFALEVGQVATNRRLAHLKRFGEVRQRGKPLSPDKLQELGTTLFSQHWQLRASYVLAAEHYEKY
jgi:hypothetical protein